MTADASTTINARLAPRERPWQARAPAAPRCDGQGAPATPRWLGALRCPGFRGEGNRTGTYQPKQPAPSACDGDRPERGATGSSLTCGQHTSMWGTCQNPFATLSGGRRAAGAIARALIRRRSSAATHVVKPPAQDPVGAHERAIPLRTTSEAFARRTMCEVSGIRFETHKSTHPVRGLRKPYHERSIARAASRNVLESRSSASRHGQNRNNFNTHSEAEWATVHRPCWHMISGPSNNGLSPRCSLPGLPKDRFVNVVE